MPKELYVLRDKSSSVFGRSEGYYTGKSYIYQGERYAVCKLEVSEAKKYTSIKRAAAAANVVFSNIQEFEVVPIE